MLFVEGTAAQEDPSFPTGRDCTDEVQWMHSVLNLLKFEVLKLEVL